MFKKNEKEDTKNKKPENPELEREQEEERIESGEKKDFHDAGGFPKAPMTGGMV